MSYCRWSSDNFKCDIYAYEHCDGYYAVHVASNKPVGDIPELLEWDSENSEAWFKRHKEQMDFLDDAEREPIGLPFDGETYELWTLQKFLDKMLELKEAGYNVPAYVINEIRTEIEAVL